MKFSLKTLILLGSLVFQLNCLNFGFKTPQGQKLIIGDISISATAYHTRKVIEELNEVLAAYLNFLDGAPVILRPTRLVKGIRNLDRSVWCLYELASAGISVFITKKRRRYPHLDAYTSIFDFPLIILFEKDPAELIEVQLSEVITLDVMEEIVANTPDVMASLDMELDDIEITPLASYETPIISINDIESHNNNNEDFFGSNCSLS